MIISKQGMLLSCVTPVVFNSVLMAGILTDGIITTKDGWGTGTVVTVQPNNDDADPSPNIVSLTTVLTTTSVDIGLGELLIAIPVVPTGGVTEYVINQTITNNTGPGRNLIAYMFNLMIDDMISVPGDGLDLDWSNTGTRYTPAPTSTRLLSTSFWWDWDEDIGGFDSTGPADIVAFGESLTLTYSIDVPDLELPGQMVVLDQIFNVMPEPCSLLLALPAALLLRQRRR